MEFTKGNFRDYLIMFLLLGVSGIPYFSSNQPFVILFAFGLIFLFLSSKFKEIDSEFLYVLLAILTCVFFQAIIFSFFKAITILGLVLRITTAYLAVKLLGENFLNYFIRVMIFFTIVSLLFFIPIFIKPEFLDTLVNATPSFLSYQYELWGFQIDRKTLVIYNLLQEADRIRNCGPFWEPGAFGGYLIIAFMFNTIRQGSILNKINLLFIIAVITTMSTTAYLALFLFIVCYIFFQDYTVAVKSLIIVFGIAGYIAFQTIPFLGDKIKAENAGAQDAIEEVGGDTRMASAILDWDDIKGYPFSGRGLWNETRVDKKFEYAIRNNGFTNFIAQWGVFFFFFYFYWYYKGFYQFCRINYSSNYIPFVLLIIIWLLSFSENYFDSPFFWALVFIHIPLRTYEDEEELEADNYNNL